MNTRRHRTRLPRRRGPRRLGGNRRRPTDRLLAARRGRPPHPRVPRPRRRRHRPPGLDAPERHRRRRRPRPFAARLEREGRRLRGLVDRGWVTGTPGSWTLTDEGRAAFERLGAKVAGIRARVAGAVSPEDFATTLATLEAIAAELGWEEGRGCRAAAAGAVGAAAPGADSGRDAGSDTARLRCGFEGGAPGDRDPGTDPELTTPPGTPTHGAHHPHHEHHGHGCHHGGPEFADHGRPEFGHRRGHGPGFDGADPSTPTTEV